MIAAIVKFINAVFAAIVISVVVLGFYVAFFSPDKTSMDSVRVKSLASNSSKASQSIYNQDITKAYTSFGLSNADIAWHALNTYGWPCNEVVSREKQNHDYFFVTCANNTKLRVYPRADKHPKITNAQGGYD